MIKHLLLTGCLGMLAFTGLHAQTEGETAKYRLPYKNTYVKEPLVTENEYLIA